MRDVARTGFEHHSRDREGAEARRWLLESATLLTRRFRGLSPATNEWIAEIVRFNERVQPAESVQRTKGG
ncbi:hypothetical protein Pan189_29460 [Stratiformator vulcanicus]|uniref:Uncharacterized protein n=1 Tax=Stratiformator vulcanicus TaxID=2527980 RepID=A0A517R3V2_9PLAN|nr:hypothetical protein Pan189_29460 [Stratiformator vulcanicus]